MTPAGLSGQHLPEPPCKTVVEARTDYGEAVTGNVAKVCKDGVGVR